VEQQYWIVREDDKTEALVRLMDSAPDFYGLVFCQTKADADAVAKELDERHYQAAALHGDIAQSQREKILGRFRSKKTRVLVATDVAARGIDIEGLTHVINYALPYDGPTYTHRIGRTGRAGAKGVAVTFVRPEERRRLGYLRHNARGELNEGTIPTIKEVLDIKRDRLMSATTSDVANYFGTTDAETGEAIAANQAIAPEFTAFAERLCEGREPKEVLAAALALQYGDALSSDHYNDIRQMRSGAQDRTHIRLYIGLGRRGIAQFFRDLIGLPERLVDRIEVMDAFSLATLPADAAMAALDLSKQRRNVPHMHVDVRDSGGDFHSGPRPGSFRPRGPRDERGDRGDRNDRSDRSDRGGYAGRGYGAPPGEGFVPRDGGAQRDGGSPHRQSRTYSRGPRTTGGEGFGGADVYRKKRP
jgi:ATP-dependent RNA helicase DeaD